ncbi:hypothetical protein BV898_02152 [Hypsibius exemplaris]|uniref:PWI domain-containing protein n=1 Tax=Hypsibius exemplaris TaxID=2072580 RepID=A0A1W0X9J4_HYPEX|nr:hypothetical protein BV898_02152 [Hypsibius exemplaris]
MHPSLKGLSKRVGEKIWDQINAKLKELTGRERIDKSVVDYVFVLFDPSNSQHVLTSKLTEFLGDKTDPFVDWFAKLVSQEYNQLSKGERRLSATHRDDLPLASGSSTREHIATPSPIRQRRLSPRPRRRSPSPPFNAYPRRPTYKPPLSHREFSRLTVIKPRLYVSAAHDHRHDFIKLWDSFGKGHLPKADNTARDSTNATSSQTSTTLVCNGDIPLPSGDESRESSVGVVVDEYISEPVDMEIDVEPSSLEKKKAEKPSPVKVSFSLGGLKRGPAAAFAGAEMEILPVRSLPKPSLVELAVAEKVAVPDKVLEQATDLISLVGQHEVWPKVSMLPVSVPMEIPEPVIIIKAEEVIDIPLPVAEVDVPNPVAVVTPVVESVSSVIVKEEVTVESAGGEGDRKKSLVRTSRFTRKRTRSRSPSRGGGGEDRRKISRRSPSRERGRDGRRERSGDRAARRRSSDRRGRRLDSRERRSERRSPERRRSKGRRSDRDRDYDDRRRSRDTFRRRSSARQDSRADSRPPSRGERMPSRNERQSPTRPSTEKASPNDQRRLSVTNTPQPLGSAGSTGNCSRQPSPSTGKIPSRSNSSAQPIAALTQTSMRDNLNSHIQTMPTPNFQRNDNNNIHIPLLQKDPLTTSPTPLNTEQELPLPKDPHFPPVAATVTGDYPVPLILAGIGPVLFWPYYLVDTSIALLPYLILQKPPDASSVEHLICVPQTVDPIPLLLSGCPPGFTPLNLTSIPTYDPTRAIPPPPPSSVAPMNQPTKPAIQKLIRIQQKERERLKRQRAEKEKLLQPVFDTPTPTSESLSSKTTNPFEEKELRAALDGEGLGMRSVTPQMETVLVTSGEQVVVSEAAV